MAPRYDESHELWLHPESGVWSIAVMPLGGIQERRAPLTVKERVSDDGGQRGPRWSTISSNERGEPVANTIPKKN